MKVADEVWVATGLLHTENPGRDDFSVGEIMERALREGLGGGYRPGLPIHISQHCVATKSPNPGRYRMLFETSRGRRRLFRPGDPFHSGREGGKITPAAGDLPERYRPLLKWYADEYSRRGATRLLSRRPQLTTTSDLPAGISGEEFLRRIRLIPEEDLQRMEEAIKECGRVDLNEW
jgi:hypothetical protein